MEAQEIIDKVVEAREEVREVLAEMSSISDGLTDRQKFEMEKKLEDSITSLNLIILSYDFTMRRKRDVESGIISGKEKDL